MDIKSIKPLFDQLSALPRSEQARQLARLPIGETTRKALARLLQIDEGMAAAPDELFAARPAQDMPESIGPYRIERQIGAGGMGCVYSATRQIDGVDQRVAVKVIRPNRADEAAIGRFQTERQVLALLKHPNIATLFDWGEDESGQPYLVMELAEGLPIDRHATQQALGLAGRVALVRVAAEAIAHAHRNLIVHRDLKPGNVLVDQHGMVKVIDFGIAKPLMPALGDVPVEATGTDERFFSPRSAAPELLRGGTATPATDIYGLGVLLYELVAERPVFDLKGRTATEVERMILEQDPAPPSRLAPARPGARVDADLDAIVLCCLRKDPRDRYASVDRLIDDLDAWASQRPVAARRGGLSYRVRRFLARHRRAVLGVATAALLLAVSAVLVLRANQATNVAAARSDQYAGLLLDQLDRPAGIGDGPQEDEIVALLGQMVPMTRTHAAASSPDDNALRLDVAEALLRIGNPDAALAVANPIVEEGGFSTNDRRKAALVARMQFARGDAAGAETALDYVVTTPMDPDFIDMRLLFWRSRMRDVPLPALRNSAWEAGQNKLAAPTRHRQLLLLGDIDAAMGDGAQARASYQEILDRTNPALPSDVLTRIEVHRRLVAVALRDRDSALAEEHHVAAEALMARLSGQDAEPGLAMRAVFHGLEHIGPRVNASYIEQARGLMQFQGMSPQVLAECERLLRLGLAFDPDHGNTHVLLGYVLTHAGRGAEAEKTLDRAAELDADSPWLHVNRGELRRLSGDLPGAEASLLKAIEHPGMPDEVHAAALMMLGTVQAELGRGDAARDTFGHAIRLRPDAAVIGNYARVLRVNLLDAKASEAQARRAVEISGGAPWQAGNLGATLWLRWAELLESGAGTAKVAAARTEAERWMPDPTALVWEFHRYPRVHPIMRAVRDLGIPLDQNPESGPGATTVMELAVASGNAAIVRGLVDLGVDPDLRGFEVFPPLGVAIQRGDTRMADALLELGANPHLRSTEGESILALARRTPGLDPAFLARLVAAAESMDAGAHLANTEMPAIGYVYRVVKAPGPRGGADNASFKPGQQWRFTGPRRPHGAAAPATDRAPGSPMHLEFTSLDGAIRVRWSAADGSTGSWRDFLTREDTERESGG